MLQRKKIAAILTVYRPNSHADVIVTKFLKGIPSDEGRLRPRVEIASLYVDQFPDSDISRRLAAEHGVPIYDSIVGALTLGGKELAVDGVLLIGEHGDYAWNEKEQQLYPRKYFMQQICAVMATGGRGAPIFNDKHLSSNWHDAKWMFDRAAQVGAPLMAGSSLVSCWRDPWLEHPLGTPLREALAIGYAGLDSYGFHALETLQCMVERRQGGETGVAAVTCLEGPAVWEAARQGAWPRDLADAALARIPDQPAAPPEEGCPTPQLIAVEYRDGFKGYVLMLTEYVRQFGYAARLADETVASALFYLASAQPYAHFSYLCLNIEEMFVTGKPSYPAERTLLTTGVLEAAINSRYQGAARVDTPHLGIAYHAPEAIPWRPRGARPAPPSLEPLLSEPAFEPGRR